MKAFSDRYFEIFDQRFIGNIKCAAHIINLSVNDIMKKIKINPPTREQIAIDINEAEKLEKQINNRQKEDPNILI
jgi:hypothetical protein